MSDRGRWLITIGAIGRQNIEEKHRLSGPYSADKSIFRDDLSVEELVRTAEDTAPSFHPNTGRWVRVIEVDTEDPVGWDRDNQPRWEYTVITDGNTRDETHELFNAFPGRPNA
jgi:hypothetical protein